MSIKIPVNPKLLEAWRQYTKSADESYKLHDEGDKLRSKSRELIFQGKRLSLGDHKSIAEGTVLISEACALRSKGELVWINAVREFYGEDILMEWKYRDDVKGCDSVLMLKNYAPAYGITYTVEMGRS